MDIRATVFFDASPALQQMVESLVRLASGAAFFVPQPAGASPASSVGAVAEAKECISAAPVQATAPAGEKPTLEQVRALTAEKVKTNKEAVRKALAECGAQSIPTLPEDRFDEYLAKIAAI